ncbi:MAG: cytochrome b N-terminal domain-containing protein [Acidobacteria bacterium]|nr:cytochrome b N-terminal domain-containing protein [Acidobacteriota bacterium]
MADTREFIQNLKDTPRNLRASWLRLGKPPQSDRERSQATFHNFFLHLQSVRVHRNSLRFAYSLGLGLILTASFVVLTITGILLMVYYKPSTELAYNSIKDIHYVVPAGRFIRNIHRWSAHLMVFAVFLHMARVFYTGSYKKPREFNWLIGLALLVLTLALSFTGYLLPWDQLAFWAITIGANIANSPREVTDALGITRWFDMGGFQKQLLLGATYVGEEALIRFYVLHIVLLPLLCGAFMGLHFWRVRKDGGLSRDLTKDAPPASVLGRSMHVFQTSPSKTYGLMAIVRGRTPAVGRGPDGTVPSWPNLLWAYGAALMFTVAVSLGLSLLSDAPLKEMANPAIPENPAKAPWYFLGLQELVSYSAFMGGVGIPTIVLLGLALIPYLDRDPRGTGQWFGGPEGRRVAWKSALFGLASVISLLVFTVQLGWLRDWYPKIPQLMITAVNPGTVIVGIYMAWSLWVVKRTGSPRLAAIALFTCFQMGFVVLTLMGTVFRGPNWQFYWWPSQWPVH